MPPIVDKERVTNINKTVLWTSTGPTDLNTST